MESISDLYLQETMGKHGKLLGTWLDTLAVRMADWMPPKLPLKTNVKPQPPPPPPLNLLRLIRSIFLGYLCMQLAMLDDTVPFWRLPWLVTRFAQEISTQIGEDVDVNSQTSGFKNSGKTLLTIVPSGWFFWQTKTDWTDWKKSQQLAGNYWHSQYDNIEWSSLINVWSCRCSYY